MFLSFSISHVPIEVDIWRKKINKHIQSLSLHMWLGRLTVGELLLKKTEKGEAKQYIRNGISTLLNSFWSNVPLKFCASYILATHIETSQLSCFKNQLRGFYMNSQNVECKNYTEAAFKMVKLCAISKSYFCIFWFHYQVVFRGAYTTKLRI